MDDSFLFQFGECRYPTKVTYKPRVLARWIFNLLVSNEVLHPNSFNLLLQGFFVLNNNVLNKHIFVAFDLLSAINSEGNPVPATIHLGVVNHCIIFQLRHARPEATPNFLTAFLSLPFVRFVGFEMLTKAQLLLQFYGLGISTPVDLQSWGRMRYPDDEMVMKLENLVLRVFRENYEKPQHIVESNWEDRVLDKEQIRYAANDCYFIFKLMRWFTRDTSWWGVTCIPDEHEQ